MSDQDRKSHPVDKFIHALYGETNDRFSGHGKYPDKNPRFGEIMEHVDEAGHDRMMLQFHNLRQEYRSRGIDSLSQHPFRGQTVRVGQTNSQEYGDSSDGEIDCLCSCGHRYSKHYDDNGNGDLMNGWVMCIECNCGSSGR